MSEEHPAPPTYRSYPTVRHRENSEVLPKASVAVAVTNSPAESDDGEKVEETLPLRSVLTAFWPRKVSPSPKPDGSAEEVGADHPAPLPGGAGEDSGPVSAPGDAQLLQAL